jgi:predicted transcriptional regulator
MSATAGDSVADEDFSYVSQLLATHLTVALLPKVEDHLQSLRDRTNLSRTDIINRAITLYEFVDAQLRAGNEVQISDPRTGEVGTVTLT